VGWRSFDESLESLSFSCVTFDFYSIFDMLLPFGTEGLAREDVNHLSIRVK
jgi:hypothetical protein